MKLVKLAKTRNNQCTNVYTIYIQSATTRELLFNTCSKLLITAIIVTARVAIVTTRVAMVTTRVAIVTTRVAIVATRVPIVTTRVVYTYISIFSGVF